MVRGMNNRMLTDNLTICTIFDYLNRFSQHVGLDIDLNENVFDDWAELVAGEIANYSDDQDRFDVILVDEAQDMLDYVEPVLQNCVTEAASIVIGVGVGQELYNKKANVSWLSRYPGEKQPIICQNVYRSPAKSFVVAQAMRESSIKNRRITPNVEDIAVGRCMNPNVSVTLRDAYGTGPVFHKLSFSKSGKNSTEHYVRLLTQFIKNRRSSLRSGETLSDILFLIPSRKSEYVEWLTEALSRCNIKSYNYLDDAARDSAAADDQVAQFFAIGLLGLYRLGQGVCKFVVLPKLGFRAGQFHAFFDKLFAIWIFQANQVLANLFRILAVGQALASVVIHHQIQVAIDKSFAGRCNVGIGCVAFGLDGGHTLGNHGFGFSLGRAITRGKCQRGGEGNCREGDG
jgi:hypothetical protein